MATIQVSPDMPSEASGAAAGDTAKKSEGETLHIPELVLYKNRNFDGGIEMFRTNLNIAGLGEYNDSVSAMVIVSGIWQFYKDNEFKNPLGNGNQQFGPGYYPWVEDMGIPNDSISSFKCMQWTP